MVLEGTFFWEVQSLEDMLRFTSDAPGDVCAHARSCFIQLISKVTLQASGPSLPPLIPTAPLPHPLAHA